MTEIEKHIEETQALINNANQIIKAGHQSIKKTANMYRMIEVHLATRADQKAGSDILKDDFSNDVKSYVYSFIKYDIKPDRRGFKQSVNKINKYAFEFI